MKKFNAILVFAATLILLISCGEEKVVQLDELQQRGDFYVVPKTQKPYSGKFVTTYGKNNIIKEAGSLENGKRHGEITTYRKDGSIDEIQTFAENVLNGKKESYYENGNLERIEYYRDGKQDGKLEGYYEDGQLWFVGNYKDGKEDGKWEQYYENGKPMRVEYYKDGNLDGKWEQYYENGKLMRTEHYKDGKENGKSEYYYENGKLMSVGHYKDGKEDGKWEYYDENGKLKSYNNPQNRGVLTMLQTKSSKSNFANVAGLQSSGKTGLGGRRGSTTGGFNDGYTEGGSGGIGDMLGGLMGGSEGAIGTKATLRAPSARDIDMGSGLASGRSEQEIMQVVNARMPDLRNIYDKYLKLKPGFSGKVTLKFTIAPGGDIISISAVSSTTGYPEFDNAVKNMVATWKWKAIKSGNTTPTIPFNFEEACNKDCKNTLKKVGKATVSILKILLL